MLIQWPIMKKPEKYSSYKRRFFNKYTERIKALVRGVDDLSLKDVDKHKLKKRMESVLNGAICASGSDSE